MRTLPVIGLPLACTDYAGAVDWILGKAAERSTAFAVEAANTHVAALAWSIGGYTAEPLSQATFALTAVAYDTNNYKATATSPTVTIPLQNW